MPGFLTDSGLALGSWADEMDDIPMPGKLQSSRLLISFGTDNISSWYVVYLLVII